MRNSLEAPRALHRFAAILVCFLWTPFFLACDQVSEMAEQLQNGEEETAAAPPAPAPTNGGETPNAPAPTDNQNSSSSNSDPEPAPVVKPADPPEPALDPVAIVNGLKNTPPPNFTDKMLEDAAKLDAEQLIEITELDMQRSRVTEAGLQHLHKLGNLHTLKVGHCQITPGFITAIASHPSIVNLELVYVELNEELVDALAAMVQLESLTLTRTNMTDDLVARLVPLKNLQRLSLDENIKVNGATIEEVMEASPNIKVLSVNRTKFGREGFLGLKGSGVEEIYATACHVDANALKALRYCKELRVLHLAQNDLGDKTIPLLSSVANRIEELDVSKANSFDAYHNAAFNTFAKMKKLKKLTIIETGSNPKYVEQLQGILKGCEIEWDGR